MVLHVVTSIFLPKRIIYMINNHGEMLNFILLRFYIGFFPLFNFTLLLLWWHVLIALVFYFSFVIKIHWCIYMSRYIFSCDPIASLQFSFHPSLLVAAFATAVVMFNLNTAMCSLIIPYFASVFDYPAFVLAARLSSCLVKAYDAV